MIKPFIAITLIIGLASCTSQPEKKDDFNIFSIEEETNYRCSDILKGSRYNLVTREQLIEQAKCWTQDRPEHQYKQALASLFCGYPNKKGFEGHFSCRDFESNDEIANHPKFKEYFGF